MKVKIIEVKFEARKHLGHILAYLYTLKSEGQETLCKDLLMFETATHILSSSRVIDRDTAETFYTQIDPTDIAGYNGISEISPTTINSYLGFMVLGVCSGGFNVDRISTVKDLNTAFCEQYKDIHPYIALWLLPGTQSKYLSRNNLISRIEFALSTGIPENWLDEDDFKFIYEKKHTIDIPKKKKTKAKPLGQNPFTQGLGDLKAAFNSLDKESRLQVITFIARLCEDRYRAGVRHSYTKTRAKYLATEVSAWDTFVKDLAKSTAINLSPVDYNQLHNPVMMNCLRAEQMLRLQYGDLLYALGLRDLIDRP